MKFNKQKMLSGALAVGISLSCLTAPAYATLNIKDLVNQAAGRELQQEAPVEEQPVEVTQEELDQLQTELEQRLEELLQGQTQEQQTPPTEQQEQKLAAFTDISSSHWAYPYISRMVLDGLFTGTSATTFSPNAPMTEMQFLTVLLRKAFPEELAQYNTQYPSPWYEGAFQLAMSKDMIDGLVYGKTTSDEYPGLVIYPVISSAEMAARPITRERMTDLVITTMECKGQLTISNVEGVCHAVSDLAQCSDRLRPQMVTAYTMGIITGKSGGKVDPMGTGTRAEAATILYRFAYPEERKLPDLSFDQTPVDLSQPITIYEGQVRFGDDSRLAREGDTFVKKDGTRVVLKKGPHGVVGEGQGVAPDLGFWSSYSSFTSGYAMGGVIDHEEFRASGDGKFYDSLGNYASGQEYHVDPVTGEGHWFKEWDKIREGVKMPSGKGSYDGQLSQDGLWVWMMDWWMPSYRFSSTDILGN